MSSLWFTELGTEKCQLIVQFKWVFLPSLNTESHEIIPAYSTLTAGGPAAPSLSRRRPKKSNPRLLSGVDVVGSDTRSMHPVSYC